MYIMVEFCGAYVEYMGQDVLENINIVVDDGDFIALFGRDDIGKSVLCHTITGYAACYRGIVKVFDREAASLTQSDYKKIRFVPDEALAELMPARRFFNMALHACNRYDTELQDNLCEKYGINIDERMDNMTYQDNKLVQIIAAICAGPELFILDEPKKYLSEPVWQMVCEELKKMNETDTTIIVTVEKFEDIDRYCNCYACLRDKQVIAVDNIEPGVACHPVKVVTVADGNNQYIEDICEKCIADNGDTHIYVYNGEMNRLTDALARSGCSDWTVENMSFEENLAGDYSRWE